MPEIVSTESSDNVWTVASARPELGAAVDRYIGYRERGGEPGVHRGLPSGSLTFIISIGEPIDIVRHPDPTQSPATYRTTLAGLHTAPAQIRHNGNQEGIAISLDPAGVRTLFGMPAAALADVSVEFDELVGPIGRELSERVRSAHDFEQRFAVCDDVLMRVADRCGDDRVAPELVHAWRVLARSGGTASVTDLADATGWSRHHLARRFRSEFGLAPKRAARVLRFERSCNMVRRGASSLAGIAVECGYYDQAHLTNEWRDLAGCSPTMWCATEHVPFFQDEPSST